ncbi:MAG: hypothetical protein FWD40_00920 [Treponema sp.]|nr:hypothetical protein [Treponema sp.]
MKNILKITGIIILTISFLASCIEPDPGPVSPSLLTGTVSITGAALTDSELTADTGNLGGSGNITYVWKRGDTVINGANGNVYTVQAADLGFVITLTVTRSGNSGSVTSEPTIHVTDSALPALGGSVSIEGTLEEGQTLTADISALGGSGNIYYQWRQNGTTVIGHGPSVNALSAGSTITVTVSRSGNSGSITSEPTAAIAMGAGFFEDFEYADAAAWINSPWSGEAVITTAAEEDPSNLYFGNSTKFAKLPAPFVYGGGKTVLQRTVNTAEACALTFSFKTEIHSPFGQNFRIFVNGVERGSYSGLGSAWITETILLNPGEQIISFEVSSTGYYVVGGLNAVYIDDISLVPDVTHSVVLYPRGNLDTYVGVPENDKIKFTAQALRSDGSIKKNATGFIYSGPGVNSATGILTPVSSGNITAGVSIDGKTANRSVTVHPANFMRLPYTYPGTGITYNGYAGTAGTLTTNTGVTITYPSALEFNADGFITLEGTVDNSDVYNYANVRIIKNSNPSLVTSYLVRDNFKQRIWLRFGAGEYTVTVRGFSEINLSSGLGAEGDYRGGTLSGSIITFNVTNTRSSGISVDGVTPDRRFIYPSHVIQSDDFRITNLASDITYGLMDDTAKIKAIHDYIVKNTIYDETSFYTPSMRKKQDALTVLTNRYFIDPRYTNGHFYAVCEGYTNAFAALARASGIETRYVSSEGMAHAWNHVYSGGWKFIDVTWGDTLPDGGPDSVVYTYYMLNNLNGFSNSHTGWEVDTRSLTGGIPWHRGIPDGWY